MKLRRIVIDVPVDLELAGLEETARAWRAALRVKGKFYMQSRLGATPQEAIDETVKGIREGQEAEARARAESRSGGAVPLDSAPDEMDL